MIKQLDAEFTKPVLLPDAGASLPVVGGCPGFIE
jgi:hypothetical protein